jgi:hypothetical protein
VPPRLEGFKRERRHEINALLTLIPTDADKVAPLVAGITIAARDALVARAQTDSRDRIALGLAKRRQGGTADDMADGAD